MTTRRDTGTPAAGGPGARRGSWRAGDRLFFWLPVLVSAVAQAPLLGNYFMADDFAHLYTIANNGLLEFLLTPYGGHVYTVRNLVFYGFYQAFGLSVRWYLVGVLLTHLLNVSLLFRIIRRLTGDARLGCFGALLWGASPIHEVSLGWYSAFGHVLATTVTLWLLDDVAGVVAGRRRLSGRRVAGWYLLLVVAVGCYGVGIGVAVIFAAVTFLVLPPPGRWKVSLLLASQLVVVPVLFFGFHRLSVAVTGAAVNQAAVALTRLQNWRPIPEMLGQLLAHGFSGLVLVSTSGNYAVAYALAGLAALSLALCLRRAAAPTRRWLLALTAMVVAVDLVIAAGRAPSLSMFPDWRAWRMMPQQYHYLPPALMTIIVCVLLKELGTVVPSWLRWRDAVLGLWIGAGLLRSAATGPPINHHDNARRETQSVLDAIDAVAATTADAEVYIQNRRFNSIQLAADAVAFPGWAALFIIAHPSNDVRGKRVHFVESNPAVLAAARNKPRSCLGGVIVPSNLVPPGVQPR